jgi:signal peptidase
LARRAVAGPLGTALVGGVGLAALAAAALAALPLAFGGRTAVVLQGSMAPALPAGAAIVLLPLTPDAVRVGDIVALVPPGRENLVTHRVVAIEDGNGDPALVTQGDANPQPDAWRVPLHGEAFRVALVVPAIGYPLALLAQPAARAAALALAVTIGWRARRRF